MEREQGAKTAADIREEWIGIAKVMLGAGKGDTGIPTFLRSEGLEPDEAKKVSFDIFDEAKRRLMRSQLGERVKAWGHSRGRSAAYRVFLLGRGVVLISAVPIIDGTTFPGKLVNPAHLLRE